MGVDWAAPGGAVLPRADRGPADPRPARVNNFGLIRVGLALAVVWSHSYRILVNGDGHSEPFYRATRGQLDAGALAVDGFFLVSGYLITTSWANSRSLGSFAVKRLCRIYPGFFIAVAVSVLLGAVSAGPKFLRYLWSLGLRDGRLLVGAVTLEPGVVDGNSAFPDNPYHMVNASLWTLCWEMGCYVGVAVCGLFGLLRPRSVPLAAALAVFYVMHVANEALKPTGGHHLMLWRFGLYFLVGAVVANRALPLPVSTLGRTLLAVAVLAVAARVPPLLTAALPVCGSYLIFAGANARATPGAAWFARNDWSYGIYLYGWPIQQTLVQLGVREPLALLALTLPPLVAAAAASWWLVESRCIVAGRRFEPRDRHGGPPQPEVLSAECLGGAAGVSDPDPTPCGPEGRGL